MEKLKQQNIELTEVCIQKSSSPKTDLSRCRRLRNLDDKIKFFEHLNIQRKACKNVDVDRQMSKKLFANVELSDRKVHRIKNFQGQSLRSTAKFGEPYQHGLGMARKEQELADRPSPYIHVHNKVQGIVFEERNAFIGHDLCKTVQELQDLERRVVNGSEILSVPNKTTTRVKTDKLCKYAESLNFA